MNLEIYHDENLNIYGKRILRRAVRSLIFDQSNILLIYSPINGDYKLPGGGVEENETDKDALAREIKEECGLRLKTINNKIGKIKEFKKAKEENIDCFVMESEYYLCETIDRVFTELNLDDYEKDLEFKPVWIPIEEALKNNKKLMKSKKDYPSWTKRDTLFLEYILENNIKHMHRYHI